MIQAQFAIQLALWLTLMAVAAAQIRFWSRSRRPPKEVPGRLQLFASGSVEVGFDAGGPSIALAGVLRSTDRGYFIRSMELVLTSDRDKRPRSFRWSAFKPDFVLPGTGDGTLEMTHPFLAAAGEPRKFNVVFRDSEARPQVKGILESYHHQWQVVEKRVLERRTLKPDEANDRSHADLIGEFKHQDVCVNSYTELNKRCYWEQGSYALSLKVSTEDGLTALTHDLRFSLDKRDAKLLKDNCVTMLDEPISRLLGKAQASCRAIQAEYAQPD